MNLLRGAFQVARQMAMLMYRTPLAFNQKFGRSIQDKELIDVIKESKEGGDAWQAKSYLEYQGKKFRGRFDAVTYLKLTHKMDTHDVGRGRGGSEIALGGIKARVMIMCIESDLLYPMYIQRELHSLIPSSVLQTIHSDDGHDGFLLALDQVGLLIKEFL